MSSSRSTRIPGVGQNVIQRDASPCLIKLSQSALGSGITRFGRSSIPLCCFAEIPLHSLAVGIHEREITLANGLTLLCRCSIPFQGLVVILPDAQPCFIHCAQIVLC